MCICVKGNLSRRVQTPRGDPAASSADLHCRTMNNYIVGITAKRTCGDTTEATGSDETVLREDVTTSSFFRSFPGGDFNARHVTFTHPVQGMQ